MTGRRPKSWYLTHAEVDVLRLMAQGRTNAEIGWALCLSEDTVKTRARSFFKKLGARDRAHAVALGFRRGLLADADVPLPEEDL